MNLEDFLDKDLLAKLGKYLFYVLSVTWLLIEIYEWLNIKINLSSLNFVLFLLFVLLVILVWSFLKKLLNIGLICFSSMMFKKGQQISPIIVWILVIILILWYLCKTGQWCLW